MIRNRLPWLARPWFFAAVLLLALNDHLFKATWPGGPVTGKLSAVAGLARRGGRDHGALAPTAERGAVVAVGTAVQVRTPSGAWLAVDLVTPASDPKWQRELAATLGVPGFGFVVFLLTSGLRANHY